MLRGTLLQVTAVVVLALLLTGCGGDDEPARTPPPADPGSAGVEGVQQPTALALDKEWWGRKPAVRIMLTGGQLGLLKPCGCSSPQLGGLARSAAVLHQLRRHAQPERPGGPEVMVRAISLGWGMRGSSEEQEEAKADLLRAVHESLGYAASLLGETDVRVAAMCQSRGDGPETPRPPLNVRLVGSNPAADVVPFADFGAGLLKVRAFTVIDPGRAEQMVTDGLADAVMSATQALARTPMPDTLWIAGLRAESEELAREVRTALEPLGPGVVVDLSAGAAGGATRLDRVPVGVGRDPVVVELGELGKAVGVIDLEAGADGTGWVLSYRRIELVPQWEKYGGASAEAVAALDALYRTVVKSRGYLESFTRGADGGPSYVGSSACAQCHAAIYKDWRRSAHFVALETLEKQNYHWDPECIRCHVVGWKRAGPDAWFLTESAFRTPDRTPYLGGVGCENCHGPGSAHVADPYDLSLFDDGGPNVTRPGQEDTCVACHDAENSHGFLEGYARDYLPKVDHHTVPADLKTVVPDDWEPHDDEGAGQAARKAPGPGK